MTATDRPTGFCTVEEATAAIGRGEFVVVVDGEDRENEGDLIVAADAITADQVAFLVRYTSGVVCVAAPEQRLDELALPLMVVDEANGEAMGTAFTVTVDARSGVSTGISASDRARTIRLLAHPSTTPSDLARPGHVFPLRARPGGVLKRAGHTEAAVDLMRLAGRAEAGVLAEIVREDGDMARVEDLRAFCSEHGLLMLSIAELVAWRLRREQLVVHESSARLPIQLDPRAGGPELVATFDAHAFTSVLDGVQHVALTLGEVASLDPVLVRVHSECLTGDVFGSRRCDCGDQLDSALYRIAEEGAGVLVYLRGHEGRGIGMAHKLRAYSLQDDGADTVDANLALGLPVDSREYGVGAQILVALGVRRMRLLTNNPDKYRGLSGYGLDIIERIPSPPLVTPENLRYLRTKAVRMHHALTADGLAVAD